MITFILPGYSPRNKEWADEVAKNLKLDGQIRPTYWDHWIDPEQSFRAREKAELIIRHSKGDSINIVAKSVGILVAALIVKEIPDKIEKIILCGIPLGDLRSEEEIKLIGEIPTKNLIVFQNEDDPYGSFEKVSRLFPNFKVIKKDRDDHHYPYYEEFNDFLVSPAR